jgi:hypothetical protein
LYSVQVLAVLVAQVTLQVRLYMAVLVVSMAEAEEAEALAVVQIEMVALVALALRESLFLWFGMVK